MPTNTTCATAATLGGNTGLSADYDNTDVSGNWSSPDPLFELFGEGGGAPLWWKYTNTNAERVLLNVWVVYATAESTISHVNVALLRGTCGAFGSPTDEINDSDYSDTNYRYRLVPSASYGDLLDSHVDLVVDPGETVYLEVDGSSGDLSDPPTLDPGDRGAFRLGWQSRTVTWYDGSITPAYAGDPPDEGALIDSDVWGYVEVGSVSYRLISVFDFDDSSTHYFVRRWPLAGGAHTDFELAFAVEDEPLTIDASIATDGETVWVALVRPALVTCPYQVGTWNPYRVKVFSSAVDFALIGTIEGASNNAGAAFFGDYVGKVGSLDTTANSSMPNQLYVIWSEEGHEGSSLSVADAETQQWRARTVVGVFSSETKISENDILVDRTIDQSLDVDDPWHTNPGANNPYCLGGADSPGGYLMVNDTGQVQLFLNSRIPPGNIGAGASRAYLEAYTVDTSGVATFINQYEWVQPTPFFPTFVEDDGSHGVIGFLVEPISHVDPIDDLEMRYMVVRWRYPTFFDSQIGIVLRVPVDLTGEWSTFDNLNDNRVFFLHTAELMREKRIYTDRFNQPWIGGIQGIYFYDRKCFDTWTSVSNGRPASDSTQLMNTGIHYNPSWVYDETIDQVREAGEGPIWEGEGGHDLTLGDYVLRVNIDRDAIICQIGDGIIATLTEPYLWARFTTGTGEAIADPLASTVFFPTRRGVVARFTPGVAP